MHKKKSEITLQVFLHMLGKIVYMVDVKAADFSVRRWMLSIKSDCNGIKQ